MPMARRCLSGTSTINIGRQWRQVDYYAKSWRYRHVTLAGNCDIMTGNCDIMTFLFARLLREDRSYKFVDMLSSQSDVKKWIKNFTSPQCWWYVPLTPTMQHTQDEEVERACRLVRLPPGVHFEVSVVHRKEETGSWKPSCISGTWRWKRFGSTPSLPRTPSEWPRQGWTSIEVSDLPRAELDILEVSDLSRTELDIHRGEWPAEGRTGHPSRWVTCRGQNWTSIEVEWPAEGRTGHPSRWVTCRGQNWTSIEVSDLSTTDWTGHPDTIKQHTIYSAQSSIDDGSFTRADTREPGMTQTI